MRSKKKLSQGDLAEKLNVSRQSVSKGETGASVPELDKLLLLSEGFLWVQRHAGLSIWSRWRWFF